MTHVCNFPKLPDKYDRALRKAVSFVLERFKPVGIIAAETIVRETPDAASDLDVWVIHLEPCGSVFRSLLVGSRRRFFVNPPWPIEKYFVQHQAEARLISAHMMATILSIEQLRQTAISLVSSSGAIKSGTQWASSSTVGAVYDRTFFVESTKYARSQTAPTVRQLELSKIESHFELHPSSSPTLTPHKLTLARYAAATKLEDAMDIVERNPWQRDLEPAAIKRLGVGILARLLVNGRQTLEIVR